MSKNKDLRKKLEGQLKSKKAHEVKAEVYENKYDKGFAQKTIKNVDSQIAKIEKKLEHKGKKKPL